MGDSQRLKLYITHVAAESTFIKLWAQLDGEVPKQIDDCLNELEAKFELGQGTPHPVNIQVSDICCAKCSEDGKWYRARVSDLSTVLSGKVGVKFIDYGNCEDVQIQDLRKTDNPIFQEPPQAKQFILADVRSVGPTWDKNTIQFLISNLRYQEFDVKITGTLGSLPTVHLSIPYNKILEDLSLLLIKMKVGVKSVKESYVQQEVNLNEECAVYIANVTSLEEFIINLTETEDDLLQLNEDVNKFVTEATLEALSDPILGAPCLAKFSDDSFYRAKIHGINNNTYRILYVDYGNSDFKSVLELYQIPPRLITQLPAQALKCRLKDGDAIPESAAIIKLFKDQTTDKELKCRFTSRNMDTFTVDLVDENGINLSAFLKESRLKLIPNLPSTNPPCFIHQTLQVGNAHEVEITHVESLNSFYLRLLSLRNTFEELEDQLYIEMNASVNPLMEKEIIKGLACCVRKNYTWCRCQVIQIVIQGMVKIQYVDVGDMDVVPTTRLKRLPSAYTRDPPVLAKACVLNNCAQNSSDFGFDLERMTASNTLLAQVKGEENGKILVDLFNVLAIPHVEINKQVNQLMYSRRVMIPDAILKDVESVLVMNVDDNGVIYGQLTKFPPEQLDDFQVKLHDFYSKIPGKVVGFEDRFCVTDFTEDGLYYRGEILKEDKENVEVYYVDYGNVEIKAKNSVKALDSAFASLSRQVVRMKLIGEDFLIDDEFKNVFMDSTIEVKFLEKSKRLNHFVLTTHAVNASVKMKIANLQINQSKKKINRTPIYTKKTVKFSDPVLREKENVIVTHCVNHNLIGCQLQKNAAELRELCDVTTAYAKEPDSMKRKLQSPFVGQPCIADYYGDWYRAEIKQICNPTEIEVVYVDFGNSEKISLDLVQKISPNFLTLPRQCIFCKLDGLDGFNWTDEENAILDKMIKENSYCASINFMAERKEPYSVTLLDGHQNINQKFVKTVRPEANIPTKANWSPETNFPPKNSWSAENRQTNLKEKYTKNSWNSSDNNPKPQYNSNDYNANRKQNYSYDEKKRGYNNTKQANGWNSSPVTSPRSNSGSDRFQLKETNWNEPKSFKYNNQNKGEGADNCNGLSADLNPPQSYENWNDNSETRKEPLKHTPFSVSESDVYSGNYKCNSLSIGTTKEVVISFVQSLSEFYVQLTEETEKLDLLGENLTVEYNDDYQPLKNIRINTPCCAKYSVDESWYRAQVMNCSGTEIGIRYIDYGNTDTVKPECIKGLKREFCELPMQAIKCSLHNLKAINEEDVTRFSELVLETNFNMQVVSNARNGNLNVNLFDVTNSTSIAQILVDEGLATFEKMAATSYNNLEIAAGTTSDVTLTWFINPAWFYVYSLNESAVFDRLMNEIQEYYALSENQMFSVPEWKEGMACAAQFTQDDVWYRARIKSIVDDDKVQVEYVDFGNGEITDKKRVCGLEKQFSLLPAQAIKCRLRSIRPVGSRWDTIPQAKMEACFGKRSKCTFYASHKGAYLVDLENEGQSVAQAIVNDGYAQFTSSYSTSMTSTSSEAETINPYTPFEMEWKRDDYKDVVVCSLGSIDRFWCQLLNCQKPSLATQLNEYYGALSTLDQKLLNPKKGTACVIKSARDENWHRAVVQNRPTPSKLCVSCVDTGMEEVVHITQAKIITTEFLKIPTAAFPCSLQGVSTDVNPDDFIRATYMKEFVAQIKDQVADLFEIVLFELSEKEDRNLNELLASTVAVEIPDSDVLPIFDLDTVSTGGGLESKRNSYFLEHRLDPDSFDLLASFASVDLDWSIGEDKIVRISNLGRPEAFWCQFESSVEKLDSLHRKLEEYYASQSKTEIFNWPACKPCVIKSKIDNKWYRASVIRRRSLDEIEVLLIDIGLIDDVAINEIHEICEEFLKIAPLAFHCRLSNLEDTNVTEGAVCQFLSFVGEELTAKLERLSEKNVYEVSLYDLTSGDPENILSRLTGKETFEPGTQFLPSESNWEIGEIKNVIVSGPGLPDQFWLQLVDDMSKINELSKEIEDYYNSLPDDKLAVIVPIEKKAVIIQSKNNQKWYRAIIQKITKSSKVMVSLVDTGEWEKVGVHQIKAITPEYLARPVLAMECCLSAIPENAEVRKMGYDFFDMIVDKQLKAALNRKRDNVFEITLFDISNGEEVNLNEKLVSIYQGKFIETALSYKSPVIIPGSHDGYLSNVTSPRQFYVQLAAIQDDLSQLNQQLTAIYASMEPNESVLPNDSLPGQPCCAPFEGAWYRGELLSIDGNNVVVKFVDYGNCETIGLENVKQLDAVNINPIAPLAIECCLANAPEKTEWSAEELENFLNMVLDKQLSIEFITVEEPCIVILREELLSEPIKLAEWECEAVKEEEVSIPQTDIVTEIFNELVNPKTDFSYQVFPASKRLLGGISHIVSPGQFWVQLDDDTKKLEQTVETLEEIYVNNFDQAPELSQSELCTGKACAAQYSQDGFWYRGKVLAVELDDVHVQFVDYGNSDTVKFSAVRRLTPELLQLPVMAIECELDGVCQREDEWSIEAMEQFEELVSDKSLLIDFERRDGDKYFVRILDMGVDVTEEMAKNGFATLKDGYVSKSIVDFCEVEGKVTGEVLQDEEVVKSSEENVNECELGVDRDNEVLVIEESMRDINSAAEEEIVIEGLVGLREEIKDSQGEIGVDEMQEIGEVVLHEIEKQVEVEEEEKEIATSEQEIEISRVCEQVGENEENQQEIDEQVDYNLKTEINELEEVREIIPEVEQKIEESKESEIFVEKEEKHEFETEISVEKEEKHEFESEIYVEKEEKHEFESEISVEKEEKREFESEIYVEKEDKHEFESEIYVEKEEKHEFESEIYVQKEEKQEFESEISVEKREKQEFESETEKSFESGGSQTIEISSVESPIRVDLTSPTDEKTVLVESIDESDTDLVSPEPTTIYTSLEESLELSPGESYATAADDGISYVEVSEHSGGFDTQSLLFDDEEEDDFVESYESLVIINKEPKIIKKAVSDNDSIVTEEKDFSLISTDYQASISCDLDSSVDTSQFLDTSTQGLDASCTTISSSFEYEKTVTPSENLKMAANEENIIDVVGKTGIDEDESEERNKE